MTGGFAAMVGAKILGPRLGRFEHPSAYEGHSTPLVVIGTFLLWFGWYGFNPGSTLMIHGNGAIAARACVTTTLAAAAGGLTGLIIKKQLPENLGGTGVYDISHTCNSLLGGLVDHRRLREHDPQPRDPHGRHRLLRVPRGLVHDAQVQDRRPARCLRRPRRVRLLGRHRRR